MGTSDSATLRARQAQRDAVALLTTIAEDARGARENSAVLRQELMPETIPTEPEA